MGYDVKEICTHFKIYGDFINAVPFGEGHINSTYKVIFNQAGNNISYIFQIINVNVFKDPYAVMENVSRVTDHLKKKQAYRKDLSRRALTLIKTVDGSYMHKDDYNNYWRAYFFIENTTCYEVIESAEQAYKLAKSFGKFQKYLVDIPGKRLNDTIADFHNTPKRLEALEKSIEEDIGDRVKDVKEEIEFILSRKSKTTRFIDLQTAGDLPERICHYDTKINNVMMDNITGEGICIIDLDTVMPGFILYDFGDMIRTSTSPAVEDEIDLSKVNMQMHLFEALVKGYLSSAGKFLNKTEKDNLVMGGWMITLENAIRFLMDHLQMDTYYQINRVNHNLDRCRTQIALIKSIEEQMDTMNQFVESV